MSDPAVMGKKLLIISSGSRGDAQPFCAASIGLMNAGFKVGLVTNTEFASLVKSVPGLEYFDNGTCFKDFFSGPDAQKVFEKGDLMNYGPALEKWLKDGACATFTIGVLKAIDTFKPDMCITSGPMHEELTSWVPRMYRIPCLQTILMPCHVKRLDKPMLSILPNLPCGCNKIYVKLFWGARMKWITDFYGKAVEEYSGKPMADWAPVDGDWWYSYGYGTEDQQKAADKVLVLDEAAVSQHKTDPATMVYTGYPTMPGSGEDFGGKDAAKISSFLAAGDKPVYIGFGSMKAMSPEKTTTLAVKALKLAEARGIILGGWGGLSVAALSDPELKAYAESKCIFIENADHVTLFPRCACLVHHAGHGTKLTAVRSGTPSIVTPIHLDQPDNGAALADLGVGKCMKLLVKVTAEELGKAIAEVVADTAMKEKAESLAATVKKTDAVKNLTDEIVKWYKEKAVTGEAMKKVDEDWAAIKSAPKKGGCSIM